MENATGPAAQDANSFPSQVLQSEMPTDEHTARSGSHRFGGGTVESGPGAGVISGGRGWGAVGGPRPGGQEGGRQRRGATAAELQLPLPLPLRGAPQLPKGSRHRRRRQPFPAGRQPAAEGRGQQARPPRAGGAGRGRGESDEARSRALPPLPPAQGGVSARRERGMGRRGADKGGGLGDGRGRAQPLAVAGSDVTHMKR